MSTDLWTMSQLTERVAASLRARRSQPAGAERPRSGDTTLGTERPPSPAAHTESPSAPTEAGQLNRRIRDVPDARTIRWYQTTGIVDRPVAMRGRTALYGRRHLLQLLAIKRLQAGGLSLAGIQAELAGASDAVLARLAGEPEPAADTAPVEMAAASRARFWAAIPTGSAAASTAGAPEPSLDGSVDVVGVRIAGGLTLLFDQPGRQIGADDVAAIRAVAGPLVQLARQHGLVGSAQPPPAPGSEPDDPSERGKDNP